MFKSENWMSFIAFPYSNMLLAICCKNARNIDIEMSYIVLACVAGALGGGFGTGKVWNGGS